MEQAPPSDRRREEFERSRRMEADRIRFLESNHGRATAREFAARTLRGYRRAILDRRGPAADPVYRARFLGSYCYLRSYIGGT